MILNHWLANGLSSRSFSVALAFPVLKAMRTGSVLGNIEISSYATNLHPVLFAFRLLNADQALKSGEIFRMVPCVFHVSCQLASVIQACSLGLLETRRIIVSIPIKSIPIG
jgi:hypothetical protein